MKYTLITKDHGIIRNDNTVYYLLENELKTDKELSHLNYTPSGALSKIINISSHKTYWIFGTRRTNFDFD